MPHGSITRVPLTPSDATVLFVERLNAIAVEAVTKGEPRTQGESTSQTLIFDSTTQTWIALSSGTSNRE